MKPEALHNLANELAGFGINTLIMEWEATFPFENHPMIPNRYAYTKEEISTFVSYCEELGIDVIPLQQSFGHVEYILRHDKYSNLREDHKDVSQVCPLKTALNKALFTDLFREMASMHPSHYFHIGGDETYLLGHCHDCQLYAKNHGKSSLYVAHIKMLCEIVIEMGKQPVLWADIGLKHPEALNELPDATIFIDWNYGWDLNHFGDVGKLAKSGYEVWGAPSLRSGPDNYYLSKWEKHFKNLEDFIPASRELGYTGIVLTSWSTSGMYSPVYESIWKIIELVPIRHVYPLSGFRISMAGFAEGINMTKSIDRTKFLEIYCKKRFGFNKKQTMVFWSALTTAPYQVENGIVVEKESWTITNLLDSTRKAVKTLNGISPKKNEKEFSHFRLMMDIRENYLKYKEIEMLVNTASFNNDQLPEILTRLEAVMNKGEKINSRFIQLNEDVYYISELEAENKTRNLPAELLYSRLAKQR